MLIGRRHLRSNNSWMHNVAPLMKGRPRCTLIIHPQDAEAHGLNAGDAARIRSEPGEVEAVVEVDDGIVRGVVSLPHGWGHDRPGARLSVAEGQPGVNSNLLAPGDLLDVPSGNAAVNGIPVQVSPGLTRGRELSAETYGQLAIAVGEVRPQAYGFAGQLDLGESRQQFLEEHTRLEPGQMGAEAEVLGEAERQVSIGIRAGYRRPADR